MNDPSKSDADTAGWVKFVSDAAICVDMRRGKSQTQAGFSDCYVMELRCLKTQRIIIFYINCKLTKKKQAKVTHNSKFAKLYRLTTGKNPVSRYSRSDTLKNKFVGNVFICEYTTALSRTNLYYKATSVKPREPFYSDDWFDDGRLKPKLKSVSRSISSEPETSVPLGDNAHENSGEKNDKTFEKNLQKVCNKNEKRIGGKASNDRPLDANSSSLQHSVHTSSSVKSLSHEQYDIPYERNLRVQNINDKERVITYHRRPDESEDSYLDRVIETSMKSW